MRTIDKSYLLELYAIHDKLAEAIIALGSGALSSWSLAQTINEADLLADDLEKKFAEALTPEERGEREDA